VNSISTRASVPTYADLILSTMRDSALRTRVQVREGHPPLDQTIALHA
jgi:hypothetical protein